MSSPKPTIYYIYDALCGWCYGFSPVISDFKKKHENEFSFKVLSGGLVTGSRVGPIGIVADFIKDAYKQVEDRTSVKFGEKFLEEILEPGNAVFDSVPAAMAMALFRNQIEDQQIEFAARIQKAIYYDGLMPSEWTTFGTCAADFGLNGDEFAEKMQHPKLRELVNEEFQVVQQWGIQGFPAVILHTGTHAYMISHGYTSMDNLERGLAHALERSQISGNHNSE